MSAKNIEWDKIKTANGFASNFPTSIKGLLSENEGDRYKSYWQIDNNAILQSDLYEAAYYVIEPIADLLEQEYTVDRLYAIRILVEIALGGNGQDKIYIDGIENGVTIFDACRSKLLQLKSKIEKVQVKNEKETNELKTLLEEIDSIEVDH